MFNVNRTKKSVTLLIASAILLTAHLTVGSVASAEKSKRAADAASPAEARKLVVVISRGLDDERASVAWSIANGGIKSGLDVSVFLVSAGVDWVRKGAADKARLNPLDPSVGKMIKSVIANGSAIGVCPPCMRVRGYTKKNLISGVKVVGSSAIHGPIKEGAAVLSF
jgi:predicted peroxiredoxin